jgi:hypothetical protein
MVGLMVLYMAYGFTGMVGGVIVIFLLRLRTEGRAPIYVPDMSQPGEPIGLSGDLPPSLPPPGAQARLGSTSRALTPSRPWPVARR